MGIPQNVVIQTINEFHDHIQIIINPPPEAGTPAAKQVIAYKVWAADWENGNYTLVKEWLGYSSNPSTPQSYDRVDIYQSNDSLLTPPIVGVPTGFSATNGGFNNKINLSWQNGGVSSGTQRYYKVTAINSYGESDLATSLPKAGRRVDSFLGTEVFYGTSQTGPWTAFTDPIFKSLAYSHTGLTAGQTFYYRLRTASNGGYRSNYTAVFSGSTAALPQTIPGVPSILAITEFHDKVRISINEVTETGNAGAVAIQVFVSDQPTILENFQHLTTLDFTHKNASGSVVQSFQDVTQSEDSGLTAPSVGSTQNTSATSGLSQTQIDISFSFGGITPGATRYFRVKAINSVGASALSNPQSGKRTDTAQYVEIQQSDNGSDFSQLTATATPPKYSHTGLSAGVTKHYKARTLSAGGYAGAYSNVFSGNTIVVPSAPSTPTGLTAIPGHEVVTIRWDAQSGVSAFRIHAGQSPTTLNEITTASGSATQASFDIATLAGWGVTLNDFDVNPPTINSVSQGTYENKIVINFSETPVLRGAEIFFAILAENAGGQSALTNVVAAYLTDTNNGVEIHVSTDDQNFSLLASANSPTYEHTGLAVQQTRYYKLRTKALNSGRTSSFTTSQQGSTGGQAAQAPAAPTNVVATKGTFHDKTRLSWSKVSEASKYYIYVFNPSTQQWDELGDIGDVASYDITSALDTGLTAPSILTPSSVSVSQDQTQKIQITFDDSNKMRNGATRTYAVKAWNSAGFSALSNNDTGYRADSLPVGGACVITVSSTGPSGSYSNLYGPTNKTTSPAYHNFLGDGVTRHYKLKLVSVNGYESSESGPHEGQTASASQAPSAPQNLTATAGNHLDKVALSWDAVAGVDGYRVYASLTAQPYVWTLLGTVAGTSVDITQDGSIGLKESRLTAPTVSLPQNIQASQGTYSDKIRITWTNGVLTQGASIAFAVAAYNANGESAKSNVSVGYRKGAISGTEIIASGTQGGTYVKIVDANNSPYDHTVDELTAQAMQPNTTKWYKLRMIVQ